MSDMHFSMVAGRYWCCAKCGGFGVAADSGQAIGQARAHDIVATIEPYWLGMARSTNFSIVNADPSVMIAKATERLDNFAFRVFMFIVFKMDMKNEFRLTQAAVAEALNVDQGYTSKAFTRLKQLKLIRSGPKRGIYYVNPFVCWKGNDFDRAKAMKWAASQGMELQESWWLPETKAS